MQFSQVKLKAKLLETLKETGREFSIEEKSSLKKIYLKRRKQK